MTSEPIRTADGSLSFRHPDIGEAYHSLDGAASETRCKFIDPSALRRRRAEGPVRILDVGFGLGYTCRAALDCPGEHSLHIDSIESEAAALRRALRIFPGDPLLLCLQSDQIYREGPQSVQLHFGDVRQVIQSLAGPYDLIFHDPFSPLRNSECWTVELFREYYRCLHPQGALLTYSASVIVRSGLAEAGFAVQDSPVPPPHRTATIASKQGESVRVEMTEPFRDPDLCASGHQIRSRREAALRNAAKIVQKPNS